jgi:acetylornithine/succinyldiaminopimelate/putrescine aminotransferase
VPDILLLAKAIGGGMPLGAFIASQEHMHTLTENPVLGHITTFGGHPVSCTSGFAAFNVLLEENLITTVEAKGQLFESLLSENQYIQSFRRKGLMMALEFESAELNQKIVHQCVKNGLVTDWFLFAPNCLRICPPLTISPTQIEVACLLLLKSIAEITN